MRGISVQRRANEISGLGSRQQRNPRKQNAPYFILNHYQFRLLGMDDMRRWQEALWDYMKAKGHLEQV